MPTLLQVTSGEVFTEDDFRGRIVLPSSLCQQLEERLIHGCHVDEMRAIVEEEDLGRRGSWNLLIPGHEKAQKLRGTWFNLRDYDENFFGPFRFSVPASLLAGKAFLVFRRWKGETRELTFIEDTFPCRVFRYEGEFRKAKAEWYFRKREHGSWGLRPEFSHRVILLSPVPFKSVVLRTRKHEKCVMGRCDGEKLKAATEVLEELAYSQLKRYLLGSTEYRALVRLFPCLLEIESLSLPVVSRAVRVGDARK